MSKPVFQWYDYLVSAIYALVAAAACVTSNVPIWLRVALVVALFVGLLLAIYRGLLRAARHYHESGLTELRATYHQLQSLGWIYRNVELKQPLPPLRGMAISPDAAGVLVGLVRELRPKVILELGSGASTTLIAASIEAGAFDGTLFSVDNHFAYQEAVAAAVRRQGLASRVKFVHAPLVQVEIATTTYSYYETTKLEALGVGSVDLLFVDGPSDSVGVLARYPALPMLLPLLSARAVVVVDDADRDSEQRMVGKWIEESAGWIVERLASEKGLTVLRRNSG